MEDNKIESVDVGWSDTVVMICTKCGKQIHNSADQESPERLKSELKSKTKAEFGKSVRVINSSCLNICPVDKVAIAVASRKDPGVFKGYIVDPKTSGEELMETIFKD